MKTFQVNVNYFFCQSSSSKYSAASSLQDKGGEAALDKGGPVSKKN